MPNSVAKAMYEQHHGYALPPAAAIERQMINLGVSTKQADRARQVFTNSAQHAGFIDQKTGRFIEPGTGAATEERQQEDDKKGGEGNCGDQPPIDPIIQGLVNKLPPPGAIWPDTQRKLWLLIAESSFKLIYKDDPSGTKTKEDERRSHAGVDE